MFSLEIKIKKINPKILQIYLVQNGIKIIWKNVLKRVAMDSAIILRVISTQEKVSL